MKILYSGSTPAQREAYWRGMWRCQTCYCIVELDENDAQHVSEYKFRFFRSSSLTMFCPTCQERRTFKDVDPYE